MATFELPENSRNESAAAVANPTAGTCTNAQTATYVDGVATAREARSNAASAVDHGPANLDVSIDESFETNSYDESFLTDGWSPSP